MSDNLLKAEDLTSEELRKRATKGGIASGKARREKKAMKDTLETLLAMPLKEGTADDLDTIKSVAALKGKNISVQEAIVLAQVQKALRGDTRAAEYIRDTSGNKAKIEVAVEGKVENPLAGLTTEELKRLLDNG